MTAGTSNEAAVKRYADAYKRSSSMKQMGDFIKAMAVAMAGLFALISLSTAHGGADLVILSLLSGFIGMIGFGVGLIVSALGQMMRATLDSAVNTSPFLTDQDRAAAMSLEPRKAWATIGIDTVAAAPAPAIVAPVWQPEARTFPAASPLALLFADGEAGTVAESRGAGSSRRRCARPVRRRWN